MRQSSISLLLCLLAACAGKTPSPYPEPMAIAMTGAEVAASVEDVFEDPEEDAKTGTVLEAFADVGEYVAWPLRFGFHLLGGLTALVVVGFTESALGIDPATQAAHLDAIEAWTYEGMQSRFRTPVMQELNAVSDARRIPPAAVANPRSRGGHYTTQGACWNNQCP